MLLFECVLRHEFRVWLVGYSLLHFSDSYREMCVVDTVFHFCMSAAAVIIMHLFSHVRDSRCFCV